MDLPVQHADVYSDPVRFLEGVVAWILKQRGGRGILKPKPRMRNAMLVVREAAIFHGIGLYTASELWHMAGKCIIFPLLCYTHLSWTGLSPSLTEEELFESPSRTAI